MVDKDSRKSYNDCLGRFRKWYETLSDKEFRVKFVYYDAGQLTSPKTREYFRVLPMASGGSSFIVQGKDKNFYYVYTKDNLRLFVTPKTPFMPYNSGANTYGNAANPEYELVQGASHKDHIEEAYIGNHIDFGMMPQKSGHVLFKTHRTSYEIEEDDLIAMRYTDNCNFRWKEDMNLLAENIQCETITRGGDVSVLGAHTDVYKSELEVEAFRHLFKVATGQRHSGGGRKVYVGKRGGRYVMKKGKRVYIKCQTGGTGSEVLDDDMLRLMQSGLFIPISARSKDLFAVQIIHDENGALTESSAHVIVVYEFTRPDRRLTFHLEAALMKRILDATKKVEAQTTQTVQTLTESEKHVLEAWDSLRESMLSRCIEVGA